MGMDSFFQDGLKCSKLSSTDGLVCLAECTKNHELYTLNEWIVHHMNGMKYHSVTWAKSHSLFGCPLTHL